LSPSIDKLHQRPGTSIYT